MTMAIRIENTDQTREAEVIALDRDDAGREHASSQGTLKPGESRTFYAHLQRDIVVKETKPTT